MKRPRLPTYFISHGGGPWPWISGQRGGIYAHPETSLKDIPRQLSAKPKVVLMISGHWEENEFSVQSSSHPQMIYDYSGFPEHTYHIQYAAPGSPQTAERICVLLKGAGFNAKLDARRGFDHGTFAPLAVIYPNADIPVLQLSLKSGYDPKQHLDAGRALAPLRDEGVLIIGSGLSYHNLREFGPGAKVSSALFDQWLQSTLVEHSPTERITRLLEWEAAPAARKAHPQEDHLMPLMIAVGAAGDDQATRTYHQDDFLGGISVSSYRFGTCEAALPRTARPSVNLISSDSSRTQPLSGIAALALGVLGVVIGDIGTSPLYTVKQFFRPTTGVLLTEGRAIQCIAKPETPIMGAL